MNTGTWIQSALIRREMQTFLRQRRTFVALFLLVAILSITVLISWQGLAASANKTWFEQVNRSYIGWLLQIQLGFVILVTPFLFATSIAREREKDTFDILMASPVYLTEVILAKLLTPILFMAVLLIAVMPIYSVSFLAGGLSLPELLRVYAIYFVMILATGSLGLLASCLRPRVFEAYWVTIVFLLLLFMGYPLLRGLSSLYTASYFDLNVLIRSWMNPFVFLTMQDSNPFQVFRQYRYVPIFEVYFFAFYASVAVMGYLASYLLLRFGSGVKARKTTTIQDQVKNEPWWVKLLFRDVSADLDKRVASDRAGAVLERRSQWYARGYSQMRIAYIGIIASLLLVPLIQYQFTSTLAYYPLMVTLLFSIPLAATRISVEREHGTLDLLRTTLLPVRDLLMSKFWSCWINALVLAFAIFVPALLIRTVFAHNAMFAPPEEILVLNYVALLATLPLYAAFLAFMVSVAIAASVAFRNSATSTLVSFVAIIAILIVPYIVGTGLLIVDWFVAYMLESPIEIIDAANLRLFLYSPLHLIAWLLIPVTHWLVFLPPDMLQRFGFLPIDSLLSFKHSLQIGDGIVMGLVWSLFQIAVYVTMTYLVLNWSSKKLEQSG